MNNETSIEQFLHAIEQLPPAYEQRQWIHWLREYHTPDYYDHQVNKKRSAKFVYNHLAYPEMLLWLIGASGVKRSLVKLAQKEYENLDNVHKIARAIRSYVPWDLLESSLLQTINKTTHWLQYWKPFQIKPAINERWLLNHSAGDQLAKVKHGDVVWIVSVEPPGKLVTLGPIHVGRILEKKKAEALAGQQLWPADWHIFVNDENAYTANYADLSAVASHLRFRSKEFPKLTLRQGKVSGTQFQQIRKLEPESAELIRRVWNEAKSQAEHIDDKTVKKLDDLASLDKKQSSNVRLEQRILRQMMFGSASVMECGICGNQYPKSLMVVAHIKPRSECGDLERRDKRNLMPLCLLGCDSLFEKGFISVEKGYVIEGPIEADTEDLKAQIASLLRSDCEYWTLESKKYFDWRAKHPIHTHQV